MRVFLTEHFFFLFPPPSLSALFLCSLSVSHRSGQHGLCAVKPRRLNSRHGMEPLAVRERVLDGKTVVLLERNPLVSALSHFTFPASGSLLFFILQPSTNCSVYPFSHTMHVVHSTGDHRFVHSLLSHFVPFPSLSLSAVLTLSPLLPCSIGVSITPCHSHLLPLSFFLSPLHNFPLFSVL